MTLRFKSMARTVSVAAVFALALLLTSAQPAEPQTKVSTHWSGWYGVYTPCKNDAQMQWDRLSNDSNRTNRHYWRGRLSSPDATAWYVRVWGRANWSTWNVAYKFPNTGNYFGPFETGLATCGEWTNGYIDHAYTAHEPSVTHDFRIRCDTPCLNFGVWKRIGIKAPPGGYWQTLFTGSYSW